MVPTLLVLAAGIGSRYGGLKQIDPVGPNGETIIDYSIYDAIRAGFGRLVFVIRPEIETDFKELIGKKFEGRLAVDYVYQELDMLPDNFILPPQRVKPWGTGHAILVAAGAIQEPFAAINGDDFYGATSFQLLGDYLRVANDHDSANYAMVGFVLRNTLSEFGSVARGVCRVDEHNFLQHVVELTKIEKEGDRAKYTAAAGQIHPLTGNEIVSMNMWGFTPSIFTHLRQQFIDFLQAHQAEAKAEFFIPTVVNTLVAQGQARVKVLSSQDSWFGITYQEDKPYVTRSIRRLIAQGVYPEKLWP